MSKAKFIEIDSQADLKPLFKELCQVLDMKENDVKRLVLQFKGADFAINAKEITASDIMTICEKSKMTFKFRIDYEDVVIRENEKALGLKDVPEPHEGFRQSDVSKRMDKQKEDIKDASLLEREHVTQFIPEPIEKYVPPIDPKKIPDFK